MKYKALIIDDEPAASESIEIIISEFCPDILIAGIANTPKEGISLILKTKPDIVFLDIEMPAMTGFELLKTIPDKNFDVVFITAYNHYATEAFKVHAIDYILKPVNIEDLVSAVNKIIKNREKNIPVTHPYEKILNENLAVQSRKFSVPSAEGIDFLNMDDILYLEADEGYTHIFIPKKKYTTSKRMKELTEQLDPKCFVRVHNSYLVNLNHIIKYHTKESYLEMSNNQMIPVSRRNKDEFIMAAKNFGLMY